MSANGTRVDECAGAARMRLQHPATSPPGRDPTERRRSSPSLCGGRGRWRSRRRETPPARPAPCPGPPGPFPPVNVSHSRSSRRRSGSCSRSKYRPPRDWGRGSSCRTAGALAWIDQPGPLLGVAGALLVLDAPHELRDHEVEIGVALTVAVGGEVDRHSGHGQQVLNRALRAGHHSRPEPRPPAEGYGAAWPWGSACGCRCEWFAAAGACAWPWVGQRVRVLMVPIGTDSWLLRADSLDRAARPRAQYRPSS